MPSLDTEASPNAVGVERHDPSTWRWARVVVRAKRPGWHGGGATAALSTGCGGGVRGREKRKITVEENKERTN